MKIEGVKIEIPPQDKKQFAIDRFEEVSFDLPAYTDLFDRVVELAEMENSHFDDAVVMSAMVGCIFKDLVKKKSWGKDPNFRFNLKEIKLATLFHDIGKSGPAHFAHEDRLLIQQFFDNKLFETPEIKKLPYAIRNMKLAEAIKQVDFKNKERLFELLLSLDIKLEEETLIQFWRRHDDWTYDVLSKTNKEKPESIPKKVIDIASSHHILEGKNPAKIDLNNIPTAAKALESVDKYQIIVLTLVDKYEAFLKRSDQTHKQAVSSLVKMVKENIYINDEQKKDYLEVIRMIDKNKSGIFKSIGDLVLKK